MTNTGRRRVPGESSVESGHGRGGSRSMKPRGAAELFGDPSFPGERSRLHQAHFPHPLPTFRAALSVFRMEPAHQVSAMLTAQQRSHLNLLCSLEAPTGALSRSIPRPADGPWRSERYATSISQPCDTAPIRETERE